MSRKGVQTMANAVQFHDDDMKRAWEEAIVAERDAALHPERTAERRRRLIRWVAARDLAAHVA
ncbi:hypothetical protein [Mycolicibacterium bacteremicum]|uniref:hypothetical protein n=1 Tax=Mycolicibacterium bacteremicum TaxID=564198 RepID=UPI001054C6A9|nr:hypothetical protein [Mycolicibacterium bacteremicum]MCV7434231.1 hypothetical protein [Mycolicibacterium bacteremicum]